MLLPALKALYRPDAPSTPSPPDGLRSLPDSWGHISHLSPKHPDGFNTLITPEVLISLMGEGQPSTSVLSLLGDLTQPELELLPLRLFWRSLPLEDLDFVRLKVTLLVTLLLGAE